MAASAARKAFCTRREGRNQSERGNETQTKTQLRNRSSQNAPLSKLNKPKKANKKGSKMKPAYMYGLVGRDIRSQLFLQLLRQIRLQERNLR